MSRTINRTPRHLDDPLKILGFSLAQWAILALGVLCLWACLMLLPAAIPTTLRLSLGALLVGVPLGLTFAGSTTHSIVELPRRLWHSLATPADFLPGPPRRGPLSLALTEGDAREEEPDA
ncbi:MAG: PrgI family protein [Chloroflexota bacterium]|nr:PrgI family protein [Chloroflexota bacterium]